MAVLTPAEVAQLVEEIRDASTAIAITTAGYPLTDSDRKRIEDSGYLDPASGESDLMLGSFRIGQVLSDQPESRDWTYAEFEKHLKTTAPSLSEHEKLAIEAARGRAGTYCVGLGNRISGDLGQILIDADAELAERTRQHIRDKTVDKLDKRQSISQLKTALGLATEDWSRDWDRIARTESHSAHQEGFLSAVSARHGDAELLAKVPEPDACPHCLEHYMEDGKPKARPASWWEGQGVSNAGRKAADWQPVLGAMHPWCRCQLLRVPSGWGFDDDGDLVPIEDEVEKSAIFASRASADQLSFDDLLPTIDPVALWRKSVIAVGIRPEDFGEFVKAARRGQSEARIVLDKVQALVKGGDKQIGTMGHFGDPARTAGANVRTHKVGAPRTDWPPDRKKKKRKKRKSLEDPRKKYDLTGLKKPDGWAHEYKAADVVITTRSKDRKPKTDARANLELQQRSRAELRQGSKLADLEIHK